MFSVLLYFKLKYLRYEEPGIYQQDTKYKQNNATLMKV